MYTQNYTVKVDTTLPAIKLELPENHNATESSMTNFFFNVTDIMANITSCELIVNNVTKDTTVASPVAEKATLNLTASLTNGDHYWWINCTDANGWENMSIIRNMSVTVLNPTIQTVVGSYEQGQKATIEGENWNPTQTITINLTLSDNSNYIFNTTSDGSGQINAEYNISYNHALGQQNITAYQYSDPSDNATNYFTVTARTAAITINQTDFYEGQSVFINGTGFSINGTVTIKLFNSGGSEQHATSLDPVGGFNFTYNISYSETLGLWNVTVTDDLYANLNGTNNFTVNDRVANISTDKSSYGPTETVILSGSWFSTLGNTRVTLTDMDSNQIAPEYPQDESANGLGDMSHSWLINNTCAGNFSFNVYDLTHNELNDTVNFTISDSSDSQDTAASAAYKNSPAGSENIAFINTSNNVRSNISIAASSQDYYLEMNWTNTFIPGTVIDSATFWVEHYEGSDRPAVTLRWFNGATYENVNCGEISNTLTEANQSCDISSQIANYTLANDISLRLIFRKTSGGGTFGYVDYTHINISFSGAATCTEWGNSAPIINEMSILNPINLLAGRTKTVYCNASVTDSEEDMVSANATFYYFLNGSTDPDNNNVHYTNTSCTFSGTTTKTVSCAFQTLYYANNGTWYCNMTTNDGNLTDNNFNMTIISPLYAVNITPTLLDYGDIPLGANSANMTVNVTNLGNMPINVSVWGYGGTNSNSTGGGLSFMCNQEGNITIGYERYTTNISQTFTDKTSLISGPALLPMTIFKQTQPATQIINNTYWETQIDATNNPKGTCNGTIIFTAEAS